MRTQSCDITLPRPTVVRAICIDFMSFSVQENVRRQMCERERATGACVHEGDMAFISIEPAGVHVVVSRALRDGLSQSSTAHSTETQSQTRYTKGQHDRDLVQPASEVRRAHSRRDCACQCVRPGPAAKDRAAARCGAQILRVRALWLAKRPG